MDELHPWSAQVSWLSATYQPWGAGSSDRKGGAGLLIPFSLQCRCILGCLVDAEFEVEHAFVLQHDSLGFLGALDYGTKVDGRGRLNTVLAVHSFCRHPHWDVGNNLASFTQAGVYQLHPQEGVVNKAKRPASTPVHSLHPRPPTVYPPCLNTSSRVRFSAPLRKPPKWF